MANLIKTEEDTERPIMRCYGPSSHSDSARVVCGACGRRFWPDLKGQRFCDHECYSASLRVAIQDRFWSKVNKEGTLPRNTALGPCWLWTASTIRGYGQIASVVNGKRRPVYAHRVAWELTNGPIQERGLNVLHKCDVPLCVNPNHLFLGTQQQNLADARAKGRLNEKRPRRCKLTYEQREAIFNAPTARGVGVMLAIQYGVTKNAISRIRAGRFAAWSLCSTSHDRAARSGEVT